MSSVALLAETSDRRLSAAADHLVTDLGARGLTRVDPAANADVVLVVTDRSLPELSSFVSRVPVLLVGPSLAAHAESGWLAEAAGVVPGRAMPVHEARLRPGPDADEVAARFDGELLLRDSWLQLDKVVDDVEVLFTAMAGLTQHAVMTWRPATGVGVLTVGSRPETIDDPMFRRLVHRWVRHVLGQHDGADVRVGLLGYGAIGAEHVEAISAVDGLGLSAVCDKNPMRIEAARSSIGGADAHGDGEALLAADGVDLVVVSTPPNTHAEWTLRALAAGKHVVVEKPFCLTTAEADKMIARAAEVDRALVVYQNRRWDADYLALKAVVQSGRIGDVFHYESFVGGYGHPCNFWHSDEEISGGAVYDWGSHYLDWALDLMPQQVLHVTAAAHKRVWHDVTNADHSRVTMRFADGAEAEFVHSDLAAAGKPKWYVLGTEGAVVGQWRHPEEPAVLAVYDADGSVTALAVPPPPAYAFHRELADLLLSRAPMSLTPAGSRRNVAVMEAATISAQEDGRPVTPG